MKNDKATIVKVIKEQGLLPLYFNTNKEVSIEILKALYKAGIRAVEYTDRGVAAYENFTAMVQFRNAELPGLYLGIGTLKKQSDAERYKEAGADFFISPGFVTEIAAYALSHDLLYAPGCMTPTEIIAASQVGVRFIKLFPGNVLGPGFMKSIAAVFPELDFMPTGGVEPTDESVGNWFSAGVCAVGMGSNLVTAELVSKADYEGITANTKDVLEIVQKYLK